MRFFTETGKSNALPVLFGLSFIVFAWFALSLALGSLFLAPIIAFGMVVIGITSAFIAGKLLIRASSDVRIVFAAALIFAILIGHFSEPTIFSGRDQGSIAEAAFELAHNGQLAFSTPAVKAFFDIYGPGTALNFPGFAYTDQGSLITQFPLGYTSWLASFVALFGTAGLAIANGLLLFLFLVTLYGLLRLFAHPYYAFSGFILALASFLPSWFAKATLTENLSAFLFVFLAYSLVLFLREGRFIFYASILLSGGLFAFTRLEGFVFLGIALIIMFFSPHTRAIWKTYPVKSIAIPGIVFSFFLLRDFFINLPYYKMAAKGLARITSTAGSGIAANSEPLALGSVFFIYGLLVLFVVGCFGVLVFIRKRRYECLIPALIALPTFIYLFSPNITPDYPWMLRRYLFSIFPALLFSSVIGLALLFDTEGATPIARPHGKRLFFITIILTSLLFLELPASIHGFSFAENRGLAGQIDAFSQKFSDHDLLLVDRFATGDGFAMLSGPARFLFGKDTVYFFNPEDFGRLDTSAFEHVFLLVPEEEAGRYTAAFGDRLVLKESSSFTTEQFENLSLRKDMPRLPEKSTLRTDDLLFQFY